MTVEQQKAVEDYLIKHNFLCGYNPKNGGTFDKYVEEQKILTEKAEALRIEEYIERQNLIIEGGGHDRETTSMITEYRKHRIKEVINENLVRWLYEAGKIVDNVSNISSAILKTIMKMYNSKTLPKHEYTINTGRVSYYKIEFKQNVESLGNKTCSTINVDCTVYECRSQEQVDELRNNNKLNPAFVGMRGTIEIPIAKLGKEWGKMEVFRNVTHELTHKFQISNNTKITNDKDYETYNQEYNSITKQALGSDHNDFRKFSHVNYYFVKSEISANVNSLKDEIKRKKNFTRANYMDAYKHTAFYKEHSEMLKEYQGLCSLPDGKWDGFRKMAQKNGFYKPTTRLQTTEKWGEFKTRWIGFIDRMIEYMNKSIYRVLYTEIEEREAKTAQTKTSTTGNVNKKTI